MAIEVTLYCASPCPFGASLPKGEGMGNKKRPSVPVSGDERPDKVLRGTTRIRLSAHSIRRSHALDPVTAVTPASPTVISDRSSRGKALCPALSGSHQSRSLCHTQCEHTTTRSTLLHLPAYSSTNKWKVQAFFLGKTLFLQGTHEMRALGVNEKGTAHRPFPTIDYSAFSTLHSAFPPGKPWPAGSRPGPGP